jgi:hypothetical protein
VVGKDGTFLGRARATLSGTQPGQEFGGAEGLRDVIIGPSIERGDFVVLGITDGEDDDGDFAPFAQPAEDFLAVEVGQAEIEEDDVRAPKSDGLQPLLTSGNLVNGIARAHEGHAEQTANLHLIVDNQGVHAGIWISPPMGRCNRKRAPPAGRFSAVSVP